MRGRPQGEIPQGAATAAVARHVAEVQVREIHSRWQRGALMVAWWNASASVCHATRRVAIVAGHVGERSPIRMQRGLLRLGKLSRGYGGWESERARPGKLELTHTDARHMSSLMSDDVCDHDRYVRNVRQPACITVHARACAAMCMYRATSTALSREQAHSLRSAPSPGQNISGARDNNTVCLGVGLV